MSETANPYRKVHISTTDHELLKRMAIATNRTLRAELSLALQQRAATLGLLATEENGHDSKRADRTG